MKLTISQIRAEHMAAGFHSFDRKTLRFFGETMRNWSAGRLTDDGLGQWVYRSGGRAGSAQYVFNFATKALRKTEIFATSNAA